MPDSNRNTTGLPVLSAGNWIDQLGTLLSLKSFVTFVPSKVNRRQARQGELRSKRRSSGGESALGYKVNRRQAREGALGYKVYRRQARQGELRSKRKSSGGEGALGDVVSNIGLRTQ